MDTKLRIINIVGARPQFIKYGSVSRAIGDLKETGVFIESLLLHTGQHYDYEMSQVFFDQLRIPAPDYNLGVGSGLHGEQTGQMLKEIERVLIELKPDLVLVYGDTNSTLAGALAAAKLGIPVAHIEAGLRSFVRAMPEEINRVLTDHLSNLLFCPTSTSVENLSCEGITTGVHEVGDVMFDSLLYCLELAKMDSVALKQLGLEGDKYILLTLHRAENTDNFEKLNAIFSALSRLKNNTFLFPMHPRCRKAIAAAGITLPRNVLVSKPLGYLEMLWLEKNAEMILTDSGGVQKEAYLLKVPCVTLRKQTEWVETVHAGWNVIVGADIDNIMKAVESFKPAKEWHPLFGDGRSAKHIMDILLTI